MSRTTKDVLRVTATNGVFADAAPVSQPISGVDIPILYEDEGQEDIGESDIHTRTGDILFYGVKFHLASQPQYRVFWNLNLHYSLDRPEAYISPDLMIVKPPRPLPEDLASYRIGHGRPAPWLVMEVLSERTFQQRDLTDKPRIYATLRAAEYILVDVTGQFLPERLLLKRRQPQGTWIDEQDPDGGVTSQLGFRLILDTDGQVRVVDAQSGKRYARPEEAQAAMDRLRALEEELARLRGATAKDQPKGKGRRRKS